MTIEPYGRLKPSCAKGPTLVQFMVDIEQEVDRSHSPPPRTIALGELNVVSEDTLRPPLDAKLYSRGWDSAV